MHKVGAGFIVSAAGEAKLTSTGIFTLEKNERGTLKVIIAGSRSITDYVALQHAIAQTDFSISEVVSGCARGVDSLGERWAIQHAISIHKFPADWGRFGRAAGHYRNSEMAAYADAAIILWDGQSRGTLDMIDKMRRVGKPFEVYTETGSKFSIKI